MRTAEQTKAYNAKRRGPHKRYNPTSKATTRSWPVIFRDGRPLPSDQSVDSVITIFDGTGKPREFIDPTTRIAVEAVAPYRRLGCRRDAKDMEPEPEAVEV
jgi:hypothetical protein